MADGFDDKMKLKRTLAWKKLRGNSVVCCFLLVLCMAVLWICFNLELNLPAVPVVWKLCSSQLFLFMVINVIVIVLVVMSGCLRPSNGQEDYFYDEFVRRNQAARKYCAPRAVADAENADNSEAEKPLAEAIEVSSSSVPKKLETARSFGGTEKPRGRKLRRSESADIKQIRENCEEVEVSNSLIVVEVPSNEEAMPAEELQKKFEEFITNFRIRIQQEGRELSG